MLSIFCDYRFCDCWARRNNKQFFPSLRSHALISMIEYILLYYYYTWETFLAGESSAVSFLQYTTGQCDCATITETALRMHKMKKKGLIMKR